MIGQSANTERPIAAFILSLLGGLVILGGSSMMISFYSSSPYYGYGGMMGGYYGMMGGYYGMMRGLGIGGYPYVLSAIGIISGIIILIGTLMLYTRPSKATIWGVLILAFSVASFFGMGGFFFGAILGVVGGVLAITLKH